MAGRQAGSPASVRENWILVASDRDVSVADVTQLTPILVDTIDIQVAAGSEQIHSIYNASVYNRSGAVEVTEGGPIWQPNGTFPILPGAWFQLYRVKKSTPDRIEVYLVITNGSGGSILVDYAVWKAAGVNK